MQNKDLKKILVYLSEAYPIFAVSSAKFLVWQDGIGDINPEIVFKAVQQHIKESKYPPAISEIRELCIKIIDPYQSPDDAWEEIIKAIRDYGIYRPHEAKESLRPLAIKTLDAIGGYSSLCALEMKELEKSKERFTKKYITIKSEHVNRLLSSSETIVLEEASV